MSKRGAPYRIRFVIHLPTLDNQKKTIPLPIIEQAFKDLERRFGGYTTSSYVGTPNYLGFWREPKTGEPFNDYIYMIYVDVRNDMDEISSAVQFFQRFRRKYMKLFHQNEVYILYYGNVTKID